jgi:hypothetical protein
VGCREPTVQVGRPPGATLPAPTVPSAAEERTAPAWRCSPSSPSSSPASLLRGRIAQPRAVGGTAATRIRIQRLGSDLVSAHVTPAMNAWERTVGLHRASRWTAAPRLSICGVAAPPAFRPAMMGVAPTAGAKVCLIVAAFVLSPWRSLRLLLRRRGLRMRRRRRKASLLGFAREVFFAMIVYTMSTGAVLVTTPSTAASASFLALLMLFPRRGQAA